MRSLEVEQVVTLRALDKLALPGGQRSRFVATKTVVKSEEGLVAGFGKLIRTEEEVTPKFALDSSDH